MISRLVLLATLALVLVAQMSAQFPNVTGLQIQ